MAITEAGTITDIEARCASGRGTSEDAAAMYAQVKKLRAALAPFAVAWDVATFAPEVVARCTLAQLGELAAHELSGVHYRNARAALAKATPPVPGGA